MTRLEEFPLSGDLLPAKLRTLLQPVQPDDPHQKVQVAASFEHDMHGDGREALHMLLVAVPSRKAAKLGVLEEASTGVVTSSPALDRKGILRKYAPSASGYDPIVMSWGTGSYFTYNLSEKVWTSLGLSPRCFGNLNQRIVYDDPEAPTFGVAEGEISNTYHFKANRNVSWTMRNDYLRRYLWARNAVGVRTFYYETLLDDREELRIVMKGTKDYHDEPEGGWYELVLREWKGKLLLRVWASVPAVEPKLCPEQDVHKLVWPGDDQPMSLKRVGEASAHVRHLYLRDTFLERYEQNSIYDTVPGRTPDGQWMCSPSYGNQWSFVGCERIGRNLVRVEVYNLYKKAIPDREICHAHAHAVAPEVAAQMPAHEEHVAAKTERVLEQLLDFGDNLSALGDAAEVTPHKAGAELVGFARQELEANGWHNYRMLSKLAQVAPLEMTQAAFLARCKTLNEILQKALPNAYLKSLLRAASCTNNDLAQLQSLKLLQGLVNIIDHLQENHNDVASFDGAAAETDWRAQNDIMAPLFINYDLRIADAHEGNEWLLRLEQLGFDTAQVNDGYGRALDFVFDRVIESLHSINERLTALLLR